MRLSRRTRLLIGVLAVGVGATYGWFTTPHHNPEKYGVTIDRFEAGGTSVDGPYEQIAIHAEDPGASLVVLLHGRDASPEEMLSHELFAALEGLGPGAPFVLLPNGAESSYWHDRATGDWAGYLNDEVIPQTVERFDLDADLVAIGGISMGGFGALSIALDDDGRFCAVGGHSPAIFRSWEDSAPGAFDDESDFARHDLLARADDTSVDIPVWIDVGGDDPFRETASELAEELERNGARVEVRVPRGGHDESYWWSHIDEYLDFYATALQNC